nr:hypothetical protein [Ningiella sp. W23]
MNYQPFWFDNAIKEEDADRFPPQLPENHHTDICIIGGGLQDFGPPFKSSNSSLKKSDYY